jgi:hypothetical protein
MTMAASSEAPVHRCRGRPPTSWTVCRLRGAEADREGGFGGVPQRGFVSATREPARQEVGHQALELRGMLGSLGFHTGGACSRIEATEAAN